MNEALEFFKENLKMDDGTPAMPPHLWDALKVIPDSDQCAISLMSLRGPCLLAMVFVVTHIGQEVFQIEDGKVRWNSLQGILDSPKMKN